MDDRTRRYLEEKSRVFKALGHPTRLFIVEELARGERCVHDLTEMIGADISTVSRHLSVLRNARIISDDKRGAQVFYSLAVPCVINFFSCVENVLDTVAEDIDAVRENRDTAGT
ncbi:MAG: winged helix-turn-helix transcriptional regulator [Deltaproteobacteria bacterium]|nr:winged helix-turn-helix transcriptional regulator [Candidatus Zymogenaceae bacterium]